MAGLVEPGGRRQGKTRGEGIIRTIYAWSPGWRNEHIKEMGKRCPGPSFRDDETLFSFIFIKYQLRQAKSTNFGQKVCFLCIWSLVEDGKVTDKRTKHQNTFCRTSNEWSKQKLQSWGEATDSVICQQHPSAPNCSFVF